MHSSPTFSYYCNCACWITIIRKNLYDVKCMSSHQFLHDDRQISANCNRNFSYSLLVIKFHVNLTGLKLVLIWWQRRMIWLVPACKFHFLQIAIKGNFSFLKYIYLRFISIVRKFENLSTIFLLAYSSRHSIWVPWIKKCLRQVEQGFSQFLQKKICEYWSIFQCFTTYLAHFT